MDAARESCQSGNLRFVMQPELTLVEGKRRTDDERQTMSFVTE